MIRGRSVSYILSITLVSVLTVMAGCGESDEGTAGTGGSAAAGGSTTGGGGAGGVECQPPLEPCGDLCVHTPSDTDHCGACDYECGGDRSPDCCAGTCVDTGRTTAPGDGDDTLDCESCGNTCMGNDVLMPGCCEGTCTDWFDDESLCGDCDTAGTMSFCFISSTRRKWRFRSRGWWHLRTPRPAKRLKSMPTRTGASTWKRSTSFATSMHASAGKAGLTMCRLTRACNSTAR